MEHERRRHGYRGDIDLRGAPYIRKVSESLKQARRARGVTLVQVAEKSGLDYQTCAKSEAGRWGLCLSTLVDRCEVIGIRPSEVCALAERMR